MKMCAAMYNSLFVFRLDLSVLSSLQASR